MSRKKVLIVDEEPPYGEELQEAGYETLEAGDSHDAMRLISMARQTGSDFDLIVADAARLGMSSVYDLISKMKGCNISIPVCAISTCLNNMANVALLYAGCAAFIADASEPGRVLAFVGEILEPIPLGA